MSTLESTVLRLPKRYFEMVSALLRQHVPQAEAWAYGSRIDGTGHEASEWIGESSCNCNPRTGENASEFGF